MKRHISLLIIVLAHQLHAQDKVQIIDEALNSPIENVNVIGSRKATTTDKEGFFSISKLSPVSLTDSISFSIIGYAPRKLTLAEIRSNNNMVYLSQKSEQINEVTVIGEKQLRESVNFEKLSPMKEGVFAFGTALVGDSIFVVGGDMSVKNATESKYRYEHISDKMQIYSIQRDIWSISDTRLSN